MIVFDDNNITKNNELYLINIKGNSMFPLLKNGCTVVLSRNIEILKKYDVILYKTNDSRKVLHRIIDFKADDYILKGDNCINSEIIKKDNIISKMVAYYKGNKCIVFDDKISFRYYNLSKIFVIIKRIKQKLENIFLFK